MLKFHYIFLTIHHLLSKRTYLVSSKSLLYALIFGRNTHKFFSVFVTNKKICTKRNLIRYHYFIIIYIFYWKKAFVLVKFVFLNFSITKLYKSFFQFYIYLYTKIFIIFLIYSFFTFLFKSAFWSKCIYFFYLFLYMLSKFFIIFHFSCLNQAFWSKVYSFKTNFLKNKLSKLLP